MPFVSPFLGELLLFEYEHRADPDRPCDDPSCPWWHIEVYKNKLKAWGLSQRKCWRKQLKSVGNKINITSHFKSQGKKTALLGRRKRRGTV